MKDREILLLIVLGIIAFWLYTTGRHGTVVMPAADTNSSDMITYLNYAYTPAPVMMSPVPSDVASYDGNGSGGSCDICAILGG